jgi:hypothetical protein
MAQRLSSQFAEQAPANETAMPIPNAIQYQKELAAGRLRQWASTRVLGVEARPFGDQSGIGLEGPDDLHVFGSANAANSSGGMVRT